MADKSDNRAEVQKRRSRGAVPILIGLLCLGIAIAVAVPIISFYVHKDRVGSSLSQGVQRQIASVAHGRVVCTKFSDNRTGAQALVSAKSVDLLAPIVAGTDNPQLDVAVGHLSSSVWPGQGGTSVIAAHDISYFNHIDRIPRGGIIDVITPCITYRYKVTNKEIVAAGTPIYTTKGVNKLILETCYPLDGLSFTSQRYLVTATMTHRIEAPSYQAAYPVEPTPIVDAPRDLRALGITLQDNWLLLGKLHFTGTPASSWIQSPSPYFDLGAVIQTYFAAIKSLERQNQAWWTAIAPTVPYNPDKLGGATIISYTERFEPVLDVASHSMQSAHVAVGFTTLRGPYTNTFHLDISMTVTNGHLHITSWNLS